MRSSLANALESVLFVAEKPVSRGELGRVVGATPKQVDTALAELAASYQGTGLRLAHDGDDWQLVTAPEHAPHVAAYLGADRLLLALVSSWRDSSDELGVLNSLRELNGNGDFKFFRLPPRSDVAG